MFVPAIVVLLTLGGRTPAEGLAAAEQAIADLDYQAAAAELEVLLGEDGLSEEESFRAHLLAGIANRVIGNDVEARMHFRWVLVRQPDTRLPADSSPKLRTFFELVRQEQLPANVYAPAPPPPVVEAPAKSEPAPPPAIAPARTREPATERPAWGAFQWAGMTSGGVGTVALGVSGLLAWTALRLDGEASQYCDGALCTRQEGVEASQLAVEAANYATLALGVGAATLVAGAVLYFVPSAREESEASDSANVAPFVGESRLAFDR